MNESTQAIVLKVGDRFYHKHNSKRITTAWSLAGSKLFLPSAEDKISEAESALIKKGYKPVRLVVGINQDEVKYNNESAQNNQTIFYDKFKIGDTIRYDINIRYIKTGETKEFVLTERLLNQIKEFEDEINFHNMRVVKTNKQ